MGLFLTIGSLCFDQSCSFLGILEAKEGPLVKRLLKLTGKELQSFKKIYFRCLTQQDTACEIGISQQFVS
jgi:DNA-directed RNA polymerase specialized sigma subunit